MNGCVAHGARLILGGLVVTRACRSLGWERVTLQAQQIHLTHAQIARVGRAVRRVTTATALSFDRHVFIDEGARFFRMALGANGIPGGQGPYLPESCRSVDVVAVTALDKAFLNSMVIRFGEISLGGRMASVAEFWLGYCQQVFWFLGVMRGVTVQAAEIAARMG